MALAHSLSDAIDLDSEPLPPEGVVVRWSIAFLADLPRALAFESVCKFLRVALATDVVGSSSPVCSKVNQAECDLAAAD